MGCSWLSWAVQGASGLRPTKNRRGAAQEPPRNTPEPPRNAPEPPSRRAGPPQTAQQPPRNALDQPSRSPGPPQTTQEPPSRPPILLPDRTKTPLGGSWAVRRTRQDRPRSLQDKPKTPKTPSRHVKSSPRCLKMPPRASKIDSLWIFASNGPLLNTKIQAPAAARA